MSKEELEIVKNMIEYFQGKIDTGYHKIFYNDLDSDFKTVDGINVLNKVLEQQKEIEELTLDLEEMTKSNNHKKENWVHKNILNSYISKDKIRKTIEDLEKHRIMSSDDFTIKVLKELLKENNND